MVKTNAEKCREYRERRKAKKATETEQQSLTSAQLMNVDIANNTPTASNSSKLSVKYNII